MSTGDDLSQPGNFELQSCPGRGGSSRSMEEVRDNISDADVWMLDDHFPQACFDSVQDRRLVVGGIDVDGTARSLRTDDQGIGSLGRQPDLDVVKAKI